ncbi:MAG: hypothetical protein NVSMB62_21340 [Acidobacteriaceae bacterium]
MSILPESPTSSRPLRIKVFANFFKSYMSVSTIVAAAIPIPIASWDLIPMFAQQRRFLTVYTSLFCFLLLAFVFSIRHRLAPRMFSGGIWSLVILILPFVLMLSTLGCILEYHWMLQQSIEELRSLGLVASTADTLSKVDANEIPHGLALAGFYLGIFLSAEGAFVLMAIREYLQDVLRLNERELLQGRVVAQDPPVRQRRLPGVSAIQERRRPPAETNQAGQSL